jgi:hypothetical protein
MADIEVEESAHAAPVDGGVEPEDVPLPLPPEAWLLLLLDEPLLEVWLEP